MDLAVPLIQYVLSKLATKWALSAIDKFENKISEKGEVKTGKKLTLFISIKDMDDIVKIVESLGKMVY